MLCFAEVYNGLGYNNNNNISPYIWSGTSAYKSGKYSKDNIYNKKAIDKQPGIYILIRKILRK